MMKFAFSVILFVLVRGSSSGQNDAVQDMDVFRLPKTSFPTFYELQFTPKFNGVNSTFSGVTKIDINVIVSTKVITLNIKDLTVTDVKIYDIVGEQPKLVTVENWINVEKNEQLEIHLEKKAIANRKYQISIEYNGKIRTDMAGFYLSSYEEDHVTKWLAVTEFEATNARTAFPCYDEPSYKAVFNITVVKQKNHIALSNMPIVKNTEGEVTDTVEFESTPPMSTYLIAIYVGEFVPNEKYQKLTVYGRKDYINQTGYVARDGLKHINVLEEYTGIKYMLPKMDLLAIPDFAAGAMENWGIVTYKESYLYLHEESKTKLKIRSSKGVQHEFAHQWFGNLVTCEWWDYVWLNEGFATYFQYFATKMVKTTWPMEELFVVEKHQNALAFDQTHRHPITASVNHPNDISSIFDAITYDKAAAVLRMLKYLVTEELFQLSIQTYLNDKKENVANPDFLYSTFDNALTDHKYEIGNEMTVTDFMSSWTLQSGYPLLNIQKNETSNTFSVVQSRFLVGAQTNKNDGGNSLWDVGLTFTTESQKDFENTKPNFWTNQTSNLTVIAAPENSGWYIFNIQSIGFYRVNYDEANWLALIRQLNKSHLDIHVLNRAQLIDDAFVLAREGYLKYSVLLSLTKYLIKENNIIPWYTAMKGFSYLLERMPRNEQGYADIKDHVSRLAGSIYQKLEDLVSAGNTEYSVLSAWDTIATWACKLENSYCTTKALDYFKKWKSGNKISADIKDAAFCVGVKNSNGPETFEQIFNLYNTTISISERISAMTSLGCSTNKTLLTRYINYILDGPNGTLKEEDYESIITAISTTELGRDVLYEFLSSNLDRILDELSNGKYIARFIYSTLASKVTKDDDIERLRILKDKSTLPDSIKSSFQAEYEVVNDNLLWFDTYSDGISQWALQNRKETEDTEEHTSEKHLTTDDSTTAIVQSTLSSETTPEPSSASFNVYNSIIILHLTMFMLII